MIIKLTYIDRANNYCKISNTGLLSARMIHTNGHYLEIEREDGALIKILKSDVVDVYVKSEMYLNSQDEELELDDAQLDYHAMELKVETEDYVVNKIAKVHKKLPIRIIGESKEYVIE